MGSLLTNIAASRNHGILTTYTYRDGLPSTLIQKLALPNTSYNTNDYDSMGRLLFRKLNHSSHTTLNKSEYVYTQGNQRTKHTRTDNSFLTFSYDDIGELTVVRATNSSNALTLAGTVQMDVLKSGGAFFNDVVTNISTLTLGGRLQVNVDTNGEALVNCDVIKLFSFASAGGQFSEIVPATPGAGLAWDTSLLTNNGTLKVITAAATPLTIATVKVSATEVVMTGSGWTSGAGFFLLSSTNVTLPRSSWDREKTNTFDLYGNFNVTNSVTAGTPQIFYLLQLQ